MGNAGEQVARSRSTDPETSNAAAMSVDVTEGQHQVLQAFREHGSMTDEDLVARVSLSPSGARSRRAELVALGYIRDSGADVLSSSGRRMTVWSLEAAPRPPVRRWRCVRCNTVVLDEPPSATVADDIREGRCIGCDNKWSFFRMEDKR